MNLILLYIAAGVLFVWGVAHIAPTTAVVKGFGEISKDNRRIITMEWVAEGLALCFIGVLVFLVASAGPLGAVAVIVLRACAGMLLIMAVWTALTGSRTSIIPIKICPFVKTLCAVLIVIASL